MKPCSHDSRAMYEKLIEPLRDRAKELGYALAVHGTLQRDIDLIAVPWTSAACDPVLLAEELHALIKYENGGISILETPTAGRWDAWEDPYFRNGCPGNKAHGRRGWCFHLGGGPYIDLSVMPRAPREYVVYADD